MQDDFASLFAFNRWANAKMLDACRREGARVLRVGARTFQSAAMHVFPADQFLPLLTVLQVGHCCGLESPRSGLVASR